MVMAALMRYLFVKGRVPWVFVRLFVVVLGWKQPLISGMSGFYAGGNGKMLYLRCILLGDRQCVIALKGDPAKHALGLSPAKRGHQYANELVEQVNSLNQGKFNR
jgi:hypothetical protein